MRQFAKGLARLGSMDEKKQIRESSLARAIIYRFLSRCFCLPDRDLLELFDTTRLEELLQSWRYLDLGDAQDIAMATGWLAKRPSQEATLMELMKEYTHLFVTAYPRVVAPPYGSLYLESEKLVWRQSTGEMAMLYAEAGLGMNPDFHDIPDHITAELEFVSYLIMEQQKPYQNGVNTTQKRASIEKQFLKDYFLNRVISNTGLTFYLNISHFALKFTEFEARRVSSDSDRFNA